jgi:hypothetical protein
MGHCQRGAHELCRSPSTGRATCLLRCRNRRRESGFVTEVGATLYRWAGLAFGVRGERGAGLPWDRLQL